MRSGKLRDAIEPWSVNAVADHSTRACLKVADQFVNETREFVCAEVARIADALSQLSGIHVFPSVANFMMMEVMDEPIPGAFGKHLLERGIMVRDLGGASRMPRRSFIESGSDRNWTMIDSSRPARSWTS